MALFEAIDPSYPLLRTSGMAGRLPCSVGRLPDTLHRLLVALHRLFVHTVYRPRCIHVHRFDVNGAARCRAPVLVAFFFALAMLQARSIDSDTLIAIPSMPAQHYAFPP